MALQTVVEEKCLTKHVNYFKPETLSTWTRLVRVRTWVQRFGNNCRRGRAKISEPELTLEEMENVEKEIIRRDQMKYFEVEYKTLQQGKMINDRSNILKMNPRLDDDGLLRSDSRIINAELLPIAMRRPIILHKDSWITWLIVGKAHKARAHCAGVSHLLADLTQRYWIQSARLVIKKFEKKCFFVANNGLKEQF